MRALTLRVLACYLSFTALSAQESAKPKAWEAMDYGPFLSASIENARGQTTLNGQGSVANKGIAVRHGNREACSLFDTETVRMAGGWTGGWIRLQGVAFDGAHGPNPGPAAGVKIFYETNPGPGWSQDGSFKDNRALPHGGKGDAYAKVPLGPIPAAEAKYRGLYLHGEKVIFAYTVGAATVLESGAVETIDGRQVMTRSFEVTAGTLDSYVKLADLQGAGTVEAAHGLARFGQINKPGADTVVTVWGVPSAGLTANGKTLSLKVNAPAGTRFTVAYAKDMPALAKDLTDLSALTKGGPARWTETVETSVMLGEDDQQKQLKKLRAAETPDEARIREIEAAPYVVDTLPVPEKNPYGSWLRVAGIDFFTNGDLAISTWSGDVWVARGLTNKTGKITWKRYATGIFHALGLRIIDDVVYVLGRDQITRLRDLNGDGEADQYECFNNDVQVTPGFHEFTFDLQTDPQGNFYFVKGGPVNPGGRGWGPLSDHSGCMFKVSKDGTKFEVIATGLRAPNGMGVGPNGEISNGDNQGTWVPVDYIHILAKPGDFVEVPDLSHRDPAPTAHGTHLCWIPYDIDNSNGGQTWVTSQQWGPLLGRMLYLSYGKSSLFVVLQERVNGIPQGGVAKFPLRFATGVMRGRFSPVDGQLYVAGLKGWQTNAVKDGAVQRVRFTQKSVTLPETLHVTDAGITIGFTGPLDAATASDLQSYALEQNNYIWSGDYGSPEIKPSAGSSRAEKDQGTEKVAIRSVKLSEDRRTVFLEVPGLKPVMQSRIKMNLKAADGSRMPDEICHTINVVPPASSPGTDYRSLASGAEGSSATTPSRSPLVPLIVGVAILAAWFAFRRRFGCCGCGKCSK